MEADIRLGDLNLCVGCGEVKETFSIDKDGLPRCRNCTQNDPEWVKPKHGWSEEELRRRLGKFKEVTNARPC